MLLLLLLLSLTVLVPLPYTTAGTCWRLQVADRGGLPAIAAAAAAGAAGPVPDGEPNNAMGEDLGEFWCRTGKLCKPVRRVSGLLGLCGWGGAAGAASDPVPAGEKA
jgi:hypothetical protein